MSRKCSSPLSNQIRRFRKRRNLRLRDVADRLGLSQVGHIADWEKGRRTPSLQNALKLSAILGCPIEVLYSDYFRSIRNNIHEVKEKEQSSQSARN